MPDEKGKLSRSGAPRVVLVMNYSGVTDTSVKEAFRKAHDKMTGRAEPEEPCPPKNS